MDKKESDLAIIETEKAWFQHKMLTWAKGNLRDFPWRHTTDPYQIFIAEFLLQQTDAPRVVPIYQQLLESYPGLESLAQASLVDIAAILQPLGFHYRASRLIQSARIIVESPDYDGKVPNDERKLLKLPGVGKYIARSTLANAFNQPTTVLDTNVARIIQRFFGLKPHRARAREDPFFWNITQQLAPSTHIGVWNLALIDFGATVCIFKHPLCSECPLRQQCNYYQLSQENTKQFSTSNPVNK